MHSLALNHGFIDGNKRTAVQMMHLLLSRSGYALHAASPERLNDEVERMVLEVVGHGLDFEALVTWFEARIRRS